MTPRTHDESSARRGRGDDGNALVEFALVAVLLFTLIFGIINFGLILSFKQDMTRAAAEGARAAAVAFPANEALADATSATNEAVDGFNQACGVEGMSCTISEHDCGDPVPDTNGNEPGEDDCITVTLHHDYKNNPLLPEVPIISAFMPDHVEATSVVRVNT